MVEVNRPDPRQRRATGQSDPLDAYAAAGAMLPGRARATGRKLGTGIVEAATVQSVLVEPLGFAASFFIRGVPGADAGVGRPA